MSYTLELGDVALDAVRLDILAPLIAYNTAHAGPSQGRPLVITVRDATGAITGGLWGHTGFEWLFTQLLVVPEDLRRQGIGSKMMRMAEAEALSRGCHGAWLDTFEFQARGFYERLGYECFATLPEFPKGFSRYFMKKQLRKP
jgi:GNAT superfamily N-acetyltransferase